MATNNKTDEFLFKLIDTIKRAIKKYGKAEVRKLVEQICYRPSTLPKERLSSLQHLRGEASRDSEDLESDEYKGDENV